MFLPLNQHDVEIRNRAKRMDVVNAWVAVGELYDVAGKHHGRFRREVIVLLVDQVRLRWTVAFDWPADVPQRDHRFAELARPERLHVIPSLPPRPLLVNFVADHAGDCSRLSSNALDWNDKRSANGRPASRGQQL